MRENIDCEKLGAAAREIFESGYNCAQSVAMAYADILEQDSNLLATVTSSFGGGFARQREVCGAVCGMGVVAGFVKPSIDTKDRSTKIANYSLVNDAVSRFREKNGSIVCRELLGLSGCKECSTKRPKRSCAELVEMAATLIGEAINRVDNE